MGAMVTIKYDASKVTDEETTVLARAIQEQAAEIMEEDDVFVYAEKALIIIRADPIEVFIQVNTHKVSDPADLLGKVSKSLSAWKQQSNFMHSINLNVIPVEWHAKFGI